MESSVKYGKRKPKILSVFPSLPRTEAYPLQEFKISVIQYPNSEVLADIREFVTSTTGTGFSKKGLSLTLSQAVYLNSILPDIIRRMRDVQAQQISANSENIT